MKLYELSQEYQQVLDFLEDAESDLTDEEWAELLQIEDDFRSKVEAIGKFVRSLEADAEAIKAERKRLADRQGTLTRKGEWLKHYLLQALCSMGTKKVKGQLLTVSVRKAPVSCEVLDADKVPAGFKHEITEVKVDRNAINACFKATGEVLPGVRMITDKQTVSIR